MSAMALNAAISGSNFAVPDACFMMMMALPFGSTPALPAIHDRVPYSPAPQRYCTRIPTRS